MRTKVTANVSIEIPAASRQSNSTAPSRRDISTVSIEVEANAREVTAREKNRMALEKRQQALVAKKQAAALKEAQELAADNAAKEARFAEREAKLKAKQKSKEDGNTPEETKLAAREATLKATQKPEDGKAAEQSQPRRKSTSGRVKSNKEIDITNDAEMERIMKMADSYAQSTPSKPKPPPPKPKPTPNMDSMMNRANAW